MVLGEKTILRGRISGSVQLGETPLGNRSDVSVDWVWEGRDLRATMKTVDYLLVRRDGVAVLNVLGVATTSDEEKIGVKIGGYALQAVEGRLRIKGFVTFETASAKYSSYNSRIEVLEGEVDLNKGEIILNSYEWRES